MTDPVFSDNEYKQRHRNLTEKIDADFSIMFNRADLFYYSGTGLDGIITLDDNNLNRYVRRNLSLGKEESTIETELMGSFRLFKDLGKQYDVDTLGLELDLLPYKTVQYIKNAMKPNEIIDISSNLRMIRSTKSSEEQEYMKQAAIQTDNSFEYIRENIEPGKTELEISAEIEYYLRREGHPGWVNVRMFHHNLTTLAYVMAGESTSTLNSFFGPVSGQGLCKMHKNGPSKRKIKDNEAVLIDTTGVVEGYTADETRTFFLGNPDERLVEAYEAAKEVQRYCETNLKAGVLPETIYVELWDLMKEMGMEDSFMGIGDDTVPFIGHGIGLELDEFPIITDKYSEKLEVGNIVAMEPKYIFPSSGVGIEDSYIVKENGAERITNFNW